MESRCDMQAALEPINSLNLKLIQTFILVAEHQSFRHAAELTLRSQSAVSLQIRQLEEQLGVALFHRPTRRVTLTQEGEALLKSSLTALRTIDDCVRNIHESIDLRRGRVAIACSPTIASSRLAPILRAFELDYPHVKIVVQEQNPSDLFESVQSGAVDFAIGPLANNPDLNFEIILEEKLFAIVPANLRGSRKATISVKELAGLPLLLLNPASALRALLNAAFEAEEIELTTKYEFSQAQTLLSMAAAGLGVAILPESVLPGQPMRDVSFVRISHRDLVRRVALITRKGHSLSPASLKLAERSRELIG